MKLKKNPTLTDLALGVGSLVLSILSMYFFHEGDYHSSLACSFISILVIGACCCD